jgi:hypothetical protein
MELGIPDTKMAFLAYLTLSVALLSLLGRETRGWLGKTDAPKELAVRMGALVAGVAGALAALVLLQGESGLELVLLSALAVGCGLFTLGVSLWRGRLALALRALGWVVAVAALVVPSILTLALPAAALLIVTLGTPPEYGAHSTAQPVRS